MIGSWRLQVPTNIRLAWKGLSFRTFVNYECKKALNIRAKLKIERLNVILNVIGHSRTIRRTSAARGGKRRTAAVGGGTEAA
jgi:hypothetical protein